MAHFLHWKSASPHNVATSGNTRSTSYCSVAVRRGRPDRVVWFGKFQNSGWSTYPKDSRRWDHKYEVRGPDSGLVHLSEVELMEIDR